ncbi:MAG TPA: DEAD/DEAH box helicase [Acidimicrobiales bacterium]|nr:DEAD/DEAH box helicase [Acidimicrobiales bacterium]
MSSTYRTGGPPRRNPKRRPFAHPSAQRPPRDAVRRGTHQVHAAEAPPTVSDSSVAVTATTFAELGVPAPILVALAQAGFEAPLPIQAATLPSSLAGRDVLGRGRTGSGKTVAFAVPTVAVVAASGHQRRRGMPRGLVLVPTRELATQVAAATVPLAKAMGLRVATVYGGVGQGPQVSALNQGVDILVACPGRLEDLIQQGHCRLGAVQVCVLDEADHMADLGFLPAVTRLLDQTPRGGQRLLFSATLDGAVDDLVRRHLVDPVTHSVDSAQAPPPTLEHHAFRVARADKAAVVRELASGRNRSLLFTRTKHGARKLARHLSGRGIPAVDLHGNLSQVQRSRNLAAFADGSARVLVATDIAARGIHIDDIALVVHVDPPAEHKAYLHRSGRTARLGTRGVVVTVVMPEQEGEVRAMTRQAGIRPAITRVGPNHPQTESLTGPAAEPAFRPEPAIPAPQRRSRPGGASRRKDSLGGGHGRGSAVRPASGSRRRPR